MTAAENRAAKLASATPENRKPKWYHILFMCAIILFTFFAIFDEKPNGMGWPVGVASGLLVLMCLVNLYRNGNIYDDRA